MEKKKIKFGKLSEFEITPEELLSFIKKFMVLLDKGHTPVQAMNKLFWKAIFNKKLRDSLLCNAWSKMIMAAVSIGWIKEDLSDIHRH
jgi:hypothetical protein